MRTLLALAALPLITTFAPIDLYRAPAIPERPRLWSKPVLLDEERPALRRVGSLIFQGGWSLESDDPRFGGISAMTVENGNVLALSDTGIVFGFDVPAGRQAQRLNVRQLLEGPGPPTTKLNRDTEAMVARGPDMWVAFERSNVVWRYRRDTLTTSAASAPAAMEDWSANSGSEGMVRLADGRFLILSERMRQDGTSEALLFEGDPALAGTKSMRLSYRPPAGYRITDAAALPGGGLLFLNRRWGYLDGFSASLTFLAEPRLDEGSVLAGEEIARIGTPLISDNFEALSVTQEGGKTILWIASDNNFLALQRTLLLKFVLVRPQPRRTPS